jgi:SAM-dependent methyltransferase
VEVVQDGALARTDMWELPDRIVRRAGVLPGEDVLDLACGSGDAAIRAAQAGARVVAVDLTDGLFDGERRSLARAHVQVRWMAGRGDALPFHDGTFDVVLSMFGATVAARHAAVAGEIARVLRPGGRLVMFNWCRRGVVGRLFDVVSAIAPVTPVASALSWGDEDLVRRVFAPAAVEVSLEREIARCPLRRSTLLTESIEHHMSVLVATVAARRTAERQGRWPVLRAQLEQLRAAEGEDADGWYLVVLGRKVGAR